MQNYCWWFSTFLSINVSLKTLGRQYKYREHVSREIYLWTFSSVCVLWELGFSSVLPWVKIIQQIFSVDSSFGLLTVLCYIVFFCHVNRNWNERFGVRAVCVQAQMLGARPGSGLAQEVLCVCSSCCGIAQTQNPTGQGSCWCPCPSLLFLLLAAGICPKHLHNHTLWLLAEVGFHLARSALPLNPKFSEMMCDQLTTFQLHFSAIRRALQGISTKTIGALF